jgi:hypothetical protein
MVTGGRSGTVSADTAVRIRSATTTAPGAARPAAPQELLPAPAHRQVEAADGLGHQRRHVREHAIARHVPVGVVHRLEVVDIEQHEAEWRPVAPCSGDLAHDGLLAAAPVEQGRELIGIRGLGEDAVKLDLAGDVLKDIKPPCPPGTATAWPDHRTTRRAGMASSRWQE